MSDYDKTVLELVSIITKDIDLPAFIILTEQEAKFIFGNKKCYESNDVENYIYFDKNENGYKVICPKTDQELDIW